MIELPLTRGFVAIIDDSDAHLAAYKWYAKTMHGINYAARNTTGKHRTTILLHREVLNPAKDTHIDHINGNGLDCRRSNLRFASFCQNAQNSKVRTGSYKGVSKRKNKWVAQIRAHGKNYWLGYYATPEDAARAYDAAAYKLHGAFAKLNFSQQAAQET